MTAAFLALRRRGIYASSQTLPTWFKVTLCRAGKEPCWGVGDTEESALEMALKDWERKHGKL